MDFEELFERKVDIIFPENFREKVIGKLTGNQLRLKSVSEIISNINQVEDETHKNILALQLLAYKFECTNDSQNNRLSKVEIADSFIQFREVSKTGLL